MSQPQDGYRVVKTHFYHTCRLGMCAFAHNRTVNTDARISGCIASIGFNSQFKIPILSKVLNTTNLSNSFCSNLKVIKTLALDTTSYEKLATN
jgi:hypothetical protein